MVRKLDVSKRACMLFVFCAAAIATPAQTFTTLYSFCAQANCADGVTPFGALVQGTNGALYGTTNGGGANDCVNVNCGTVFKITPNGALTTLHSFDVTDGDQPYAALVQGVNGNFYGTTLEGGPSGDSCNGSGCGTVFSITAGGRLATLHSFDGTDGWQPQGALLQGTHGKLYGTTAAGGTNGGGTVFSITAGGAVTTLYSFCSQSNCADGESPSAGLVRGTDGNFYGTTFSGGSDSCGVESGCGTVFKVTPNGTLTTLHSFVGADGESPHSALVQGTDGNFYGTTRFGGANDYQQCGSGGGYVGCGTVFSITAEGTLTTMHRFDFTEGASPYAGLIEGTDGNFYGAAIQGGRSGFCPSPEGCGTLFSITPGGTLTTLYNFCSQGGSNCTDGLAPFAGLAQGTNGKFYGTTSGGGASGHAGTVFSLSVGLGPFVETDPPAAKAGAAVYILGTDLTGATSVTFNGTAASIIRDTSSHIITAVPPGATTGTVQVVTPGGTLSSNLPFQVLP